MRGKRNDFKKNLAAWIYIERQLNHRTSGVNVNRDYAYTQKKWTDK